MLHVAPAVLSVFLVFYLGSTPRELTELPSFEMRDKVGHFFAFAFVQFTHFRASRFLSPHKPLRDVVTTSVLSATFVGGALELWQMMLPHRSAEWGDFGADFLGALVMGGALFAVRRGESSA